MCRTRYPTAWFPAIACIAVDDSDPGNGGLFFTPARHKEGMFPMDAGGVIYPEIAETFTWEPVRLKAGDVFIFDDYAPHYSLPNKSDRSRRAIHLAFQRASTGGPTRTECNRMKRAYNPPEGAVADLEHLKLPNVRLGRRGTADPDARPLTVVGSRAYDVILTVQSSSRIRPLSRRDDARLM
ncbi:phytanoyl-CoA dioxygenase family protein [Bradyrhizobium sp. CCBAU 11357]|uniref:phytanoyl-CoA dioxygenase family protein n=1 Tax=Bradyrhizobium sp. CCBAU 11357 TaxID=1630808 RepID=UPI002303B408|nr:phytanoyl-CoA dioxygenase family protein [Bradyrhizobium sp. CCBAU 11357]